MKNLITNSLQIFAAIILTGSVIIFAEPIPQPPKEQKSSEAPVSEDPKAADPIAEPAPATVEAKQVSWQDNPNGCNQETHYINKESPYECTEKPAEASPAPVAPASSGGGDCATEIAKYDWAQSTALAVADAESGMNPSSVNDNPDTRDYSIGCFQINIYGRNAANRPGEASLKDPAINVQFAYKIYVGNGNSFIGQWGVCRTRVSCY